MQRKMRNFTCWASMASFLALMLAAGQAEAVPRYAAKQGVSCGQCHVNPTGGGMRLEEGRDYVVDYLPWGEPGQGDEPALTLDPQITPELAIGADFKVGYLVRGDVSDEITDLSSITLSQADLYLSAEVGDFLLFYLDTGNFFSGRQNPTTGEVTGLPRGLETFALVRCPHIDAYAKAGTFVLPYGLKLVDSEAFTRESMGFGATESELAVEVGLAMFEGNAQLAVFNGVAGSTLADDNVDKGLVVRLDRPFAIDEFKLTPGASYLYNLEGDGTVDNRVGGFISFNYDIVTYLGEIDFRSRAEWDSVNEKRDTLRSYMFYNQISVLPFQGLEPLVAFEFNDPDIDCSDEGILDEGLGCKSDDLATLSRYRLGLGANYYPWVGSKVLLRYRHSFAEKAEGRNPLAGLDELLLQFHLFF